MRRAMVTMRTAGGAPFSFGNPLVTGTSPTGGYLIADGSNSSPSTGTLNMVQWYGLNTNPFTLYTGSLSGSTFTIRNFVDITPTGTGSQSATISLGVVAGDHFAAWSNGSLAIARNTNGSGWNVASAAKPTSGGYALTAFTTILSLSLSGTS